MVIPYTRLISLLMALVNSYGMLQGNTTYELNGDFAAMQFFQMHPYNGDVSIRRPLTEDRAYSSVYQVGIEVICSTIVFNRVKATSKFSTMTVVDIWLFNMAKYVILVNILCFSFLTVINSGL